MGQVTCGKVLPVGPLSTGGRRHPICPKPDHIRDFMLGCSTCTGSDQAFLLRLQHSSARAEGDTWSSQQHLWTRTKGSIIVPYLHLHPRPGQTLGSVPKPRYWASKGSSTDPEVQPGPTKNTGHKAISQK